jgi:NTP pyrophosphatase (non-canonical NTP hydrolase)
MKDIERRVFRHLRERGWDRLRPSDVAKSIMIEGAELLEIFQWDNPELKSVRKDAIRKAKIKGELADVIIYCIELATLLGIDVTKIIYDKLEYVAKKYPARLMKKNARHGAGSGRDQAYWKIKEAYRAGKH